MKFRGTIDEGGSFTIPPEIRAELGWNEETPLMMEFDGRVITISRITEEQFNSGELEDWTGR